MAKNKVPMGHTYKHIEKTNDDGTISKSKQPFYPYTKTSAVTDENNVRLDVILEELRNFTGHPLTTDITWDKPGVYALDASVGAKYNKLCEQVFQSADSALTNLVSAIGISRTDNDNFSSALAQMKNSVNNIRQEIISRGGHCEENPTLLQLYEGIKSIQKHTISYEPFYGEICISYNEFAKFPNCSVKAGGGTYKWKHLGFTNEFIDEHIVIDNGLLDAVRYNISQVNIKSTYTDFSKTNLYGNEVTYGIEKHYNNDSIFLDEFFSSTFGYGDLCNPCIRYKVTTNHNTGKTSTSLYPSLGTSHNRMINFENSMSETPHKNMSQLMCNFDTYVDYLYGESHPTYNDNPLIGYGTILFAFSFPTSWHTSCYNAEINHWKYYQEMPLTSAEKTAWKAEPNICFDISGYVRRR